MKNDQDVGVIDDVTQSEQTMRASELSYRRLFEAAKDGILILEVDTGRISDVNPFLVELLDFSRGEMVGKTVRELGPFRDVVANQSMLGRLQQQSETIFAHGLCPSCIKKLYLELEKDGPPTQ